MQVKFEWVAAYKHYASRILRSEPFTPSSSDVSMAEGGVSISSISAIVPHATQALIGREQARLKQLPWAERVFCAAASAPIRSVNGSVVVGAGQCLSATEVGAMSWLVDGVQHLGAFVAPLQYEIVELDVHVFVGVLVAALFVLLLHVLVCSMDTRACACHSFPPLPSLRLLLHLCVLCAEHHRHHRLPLHAFVLSGFPRLLPRHLRRVCVSGALSHRVWRQ
jgi:hypothetical protein